MIKMSANAKDKKDDFSYEVVEDIATLGSRGKNYDLKLRYVAFNGGEPKYDLRVWTTDKDGNEKMAKGSGFRLSGEELTALAEALDELRKD